jgi:hypothetical protein
MPADFVQSFKLKPPLPERATVIRMIPTFHIGAI